MYDNVKIKIQLCRWPTQRWSKTLEWSTRAAKILQNLCKLPIKRQSILPWPDLKKKAAHKFLNKKTPVHYIQIFPWEDRIHPVTVYGIKSLKNNNFYSTGVLIPKSPTNPHIAQWKAPGHGAGIILLQREQTIPAGHSSLGRVWTSPNRNQNLPQRTHRQLPGHLLPPAFALWWLNPLLFKHQANHHNCPTSTATPSLIKTRSFVRFLHSLLSWGRQILPHIPLPQTQQQTLVLLHQEHSEVPPAGVSGEPFTSIIPSLTQLPSCWDTEAQDTEGVSSCPSAWLCRSS